MESPLFLAAYVSDAPPPFGRDELLSVLSTSRQNNALVDVTGLLLHSGGNFLQALEGPEASVRATLARIERDPRHRHMQVLFHDHIPERLFAEWTMAFEEASALDEADHPGLSAFMRRDGAGAESDHGVLELLRSFREISTSGR